MTQQRRPRGRTGGGQQKPKLEYVYTKSSYQEQKDDGSDRLILYMDVDQTYQLIDLLEKTVNDSADGIRFVAYTGDKENQETGDIFRSTALSVQPYVKNEQQGNGGGNNRGGGNRRPQGRTGGRQQQGNASARRGGTGGNGTGGGGNTGEQTQNRQTRRRGPPAPPESDQFQDAANDHLNDFGPEPSFNQTEDIPF